jgi:hypothetical protein
MTGSEALDLHRAAQELLRQQASALASDEVELAEALSQDISGLLAQLPDQLDAVDEAMRLQLVAAARATTSELANGMAALEQLRHQHIELNARAERDGAALRRYLPSGGEPAHFLDERR